MIFFDIVFYVYNATMRADKGFQENTYKSLYWQGFERN